MNINIKKHLFYIFNSFVKVFNLIIILYNRLGLNRQSRLLIEKLRNVKYHVRNFWSYYLVLISIFLYMYELLRGFDSFNQPILMLQMNISRGDSRVEHVARAMSSKEVIAHHTNLFGVFIVQPKVSQISYRVYNLFNFLQLQYHPFELERVVFKLFNEEIFVLYDETYYGLTKVLRDIFGFILRSFFQRFGFIIFRVL